MAEPAWLAGASNTPAAIPRKDGRYLYLVDIENLAGHSRDAHKLALDRLARCLKRTDYATGDLVVVATNHTIYKQIAWDLGSLSPRWLTVRPGVDAADHALLEAATEYDMGTFGTVVIASGDHIFAELADSIREQGVEVVVSANMGAISSDLRAAASQVVELPQSAVRRPRKRSKR